MENKQKEFMKQSRKKMGAFNSYTSPKMLAKKISDSELPKASAIQKSSTSFISKNNESTLFVPFTSSGNIVLKDKTSISLLKKAKIKSNNYHFMISLPNQEDNTFSGKAKKAVDNSIIYNDYQENTDIAVQAIDGAVRILTILKDADAPTKYTYKINLPFRGHMEKKQDGSIAILDNNKKFMGAFAPAWAIDKNGKKVPTHYEIKDNKLIQIVDHLSGNYTYPIVADPYYGRKMVKQAFWRYDHQNQGDSWYHWRLYVIPTDFGRSTGGKLWADAGWTQLKSMVSYLNYNTQSMYYQYKCHVYFGWLQLRKEYHLEHWRRPTSWFNTLRAGCNPPGYM